MDVVQHLDRLFTYDDWANHEVLASLKRSATPSPRSLRLLNHVVGAERLWLARLENRTSSVAVWPQFTLAQCTDHVEALPRVWHDYFADLDPGDLDQTISYVNSKGEPHKSTIGDVLTHVVMHGAYHRGQIAADTRAAGHDPAYTDFIHCTRLALI